MFYNLPFWKKVSLFLDGNTAQNLKFLIKDFFSKCDHICGDVIFEWSFVELGDTR